MLTRRHYVTASSLCSCDVWVPPLRKTTVLRRTILHENPMIDLLPAEVNIGTKRLDAL